MRESLMRLLDLQDTDSHIDQLERAKREYPDMISALESELDQSRRSLQEQREREGQLEKERRHFERELEVADIQLKRHKERLDEVKTDKEYRALQREIEAWESNVSENETQVLKAMAELEELNVKILHSREALEKEEREKRDQITELTAKLDLTEKELDSYQTKRQKVAGGVQETVLSTYERIRKVKGGVAVVPVTREACGGCFNQLPPQKVVETKKNERLITCENCGRILVWDERTK